MKLLLLLRGVYRQVQVLLATLRRQRMGTQVKQPTFRQLTLQQQPSMAHISWCL
jgi:hypothetical protein